MSGERRTLPRSVDDGVRERQVHLVRVELLAHRVPGAEAHEHRRERSKQRRRALRSPARRDAGPKPDEHPSELAVDRIGVFPVPRSQKRPDEVGQVGERLKDRIDVARAPRVVQQAA